MAIVGHSVDSQLPGSIEQFKRFDLSIEPVDIFQSGKFDKYGKQYELSDGRVVRERDLAGLGLTAP